MRVSEGSLLNRSLGQQRPLFSRYGMRKPAFGVAPGDPGSRVSGKRAFPFELPLVPVSTYGSGSEAGEDFRLINAAQHCDIAELVESRGIAGDASGAPKRVTDNQLASRAPASRQKLLQGLRTGQPSRHERRQRASPVHGYSSLAQNAHGRRNKHPRSSQSLGDRNGDAGGHWAMRAAIRRIGPGCVTLLGLLRQSSGFPLRWSCRRIVPHTRPAARDSAQGCRSVFH